MPRLDPAKLNDLWFTEDGDLEIGPDGDFRVAKEPESVLQTILFRLKTVEGDFLLQPSCGASLEELVGAPNSPETGARIEELATRALTHDGFLDPYQTRIRAVPVNPNVIAVLVESVVDGEPIAFAAGLDLREGLLSA